MSFLEARSRLYWMERIECINFPKQKTGPGANPEPEIVHRRRAALVDFQFLGDHGRYAFHLQEV